MNGVLIMSEKSIIIYESTTGKRMALRDAVELDELGNSRIIERVDFSSGKFPTPIGFPKRGGVYTKAYTHGGTHQVVVGDTLTGALSSSTCKVISITLTSGTWASGDAAGTLTVIDKNGTFVAENLNEGENLDVCTIATGDMTASTLASADTFDMTWASLPAELTQNLITVGDKSMLCVSVEQDTSGGTATITPLLIDNETSPSIVSILPARTFIQTYALRRGTGKYMLPMQIWDAGGAYKIGLHLTAITGTSNTVKIWGWVL
jgi:hypothetical protein